MKKSHTKFNVSFQDHRRILVREMLQCKSIYRYFSYHITTKAQKNLVNIQCFWKLFPRILIFSLFKQEILKIYLQKLSFVQ